MDFTTIAPYIASIATAFIAWFAGRKMSASQVNNSDADYAGKVIAQGEERIQGYKDDAELLKTRIAEIDADFKYERGEKRRFRDENNQLKAEAAEYKLKIKDLEHEKSVLEMTRCTVSPCTKAVPPRPHNKPAKQFESQ